MDTKHQEDLLHIRSMMERSSRFISLSGLSGVGAGVSALVGGLYVYFRLQQLGADYLATNSRVYQSSLLSEFIVVAILVLLFAMSFGMFFTIRKSNKNNLPIWTSTTKNMLFNLALPLVVGGVFCVALLTHQLFVFVAPVTLIFYGLALVNAEKYTFSDIKYLGFLEIILGLISLFVLGKGLIFWIIGFGVLHIVYGIIMFKKYK
ncbi:hypothetical protein FFWV33_08300 [Flavobacterium faecale]|uniref:Uncharacterized protein n=1 Tax=Flavobacterium faecale TaxID=1355330 RepID=A0A2S1LCP1_9FLAO|nr:hypothetical protein [Flavobacterium faecale]AWG21530.1 hypothetical protein FFWV33_08300 [Flavobacterium faecale]